MEEDRNRKAKKSSSYVAIPQKDKSKAGQKELTMETVTNSQSQRELVAKWDKSDAKYRKPKSRPKPQALSFTCNSRQFPNDKKYSEEILKMIDGENKLKNYMEHKFLILHIADYGLMTVENENFYLPGEFAAALFSIEKGLEKNIWSLIYPGQAPLGNYFQYTENMKLKGLPNLEAMKGKEPNFSFKEKIFSPLEKIIADDNIGITTNPLNPVIMFTSREKMYSVDSCLKFCLDKCENDVHFYYKIFPLELLIQILKYLTIIRHNIGEFQALTETEETALFNDICMEMNYDLSCNYHYEEEQRYFNEHCSLNIVKKWVFRSLEFIQKIDPDTDFFNYDTFHIADLHGRKMHRYMELEYEKTLLRRAEAKVKADKIKKMEEKNKKKEKDEVQKPERKKKIKHEFELRLLLDRMNITK